MAKNEILVSATNMALQPAPIQPDWIVSGEPRARYRPLPASRDCSEQTVLWDCTAGVFDWFYDVDETIFILEGGMLLTDAAGTRRVSAGDMVFFSSGSRVRWQVERYVRKVAVLHYPLPRPVSLAFRIWRFLRGRAPAQASLAALAGQAPQLSAKTATA